VQEIKTYICAFTSLAILLIYGLVVSTKPAWLFAVLGLLILALLRMFGGELTRKMEAVFIAAVILLLIWGIVINHI
jgi:hypothetical protein